MTTAYYVPTQEVSNAVPVGEISQDVYYRGLDKKLHHFSVIENDAVEARRLVQVELRDTSVKTIGPVLTLVQGGKA